MSSELDPRQLVARVARFRPWTPDQVVEIVLANIVGLVLIGFSWYEASGELTVHDQINSLVIGVIGLCVSGVANAIWFLRGRQAITLTRVFLLPRRQPVRIAEVPAPLAAVPTQRVLTGPNMSKFHRPGCVMVRGKATEPVIGARIALLSACEICRPEGDR